ncbi:unnamed protein product, partial [Porites lobata]
LLAKLFKHVHKINGDEYEPDSLSGLQRSSERFLSDGRSPFNILVDKEFEMSLEKSLVWKVGKGNRPNPNNVVTDGEEGKLFKSGQFGTFYPEDLQRIMWWFLSLYVG